MNHPGWLFKLDLMMIKISQAIERLPLRVDAHDILRLPRLESGGFLPTYHRFYTIMAIA